MHKTRNIIIFVLTGAAIVVLLAFAANAGTLQVSPSELFGGLFVAYDDKVATIFDLRFPRIFIALVGGAALAVSGALLQAVVRNPLADPGIIGINAGAGFAAVLITAFAPAFFFFTPLIACAGGLLAFVLVYALSWKGGELSPLRIILTGIAISALFAGLSTALSAGSGGTLTGVASLVNANITEKTWSDFQTLVGYAVVGLVAALFIARRCDILSLKDEAASSLGVDVAKNRLGISAIAVLLASVTTAIVGPISFLGLIVPHCARILVGSGHKVLIPYSMLLGAFSLLLADTVGRTIAAPYEISAAVVMSVVGGPAFILLLRKARGSYGE